MFLESVDWHSWGDSVNERFGEIKRDKPLVSSQPARSPTHCSHAGAVLPWEKKKKSKVVLRLPGDFPHSDRLM